MNEIERAIAEIEKAMNPNRCIKLMDGSRLSKEWISVDSLNLARMVLTAELSRQENASLTCDGCKRQEILADGIMLNNCRNCIRYSKHADCYEPKGEKACTQD